MCVGGVYRWLPLGVCVGGRVIQVACVCGGIQVA